MFAVFDGVNAPTTQTFGLGMFEQPSPAVLDKIERFFLDRGTPVHHEVSPFAGVEVLEMLCDRGYKPLELSSVMYRLIGNPKTTLPGSVNVRLTGAEEAELWSRISAEGWAHDHPELMEFLLQLGGVIAARDRTACFLAEFDGQPGAAGVLCTHEGVALFGGAATIPSMRRRGLQTALLQERMRYAFHHSCDLAMMVTLPGSESQRNAEREGFRIAYTRIKWQLNA